MNPSNTQLKSLVKETFMELLTEQREEFQSMLIDVFEEIGLIHAIEEGLKTPPVEKEEMLAWLNERA